MAEIMPAIFFGHGNPMNAVLNNSYTEGWRRIGRTDTQTKGHSVDLRSLVCAGNSRHHQRRAKNHSRFRRLSARALSSAIPCARRPGARAPRATNVGAFAGQARRFMGTRSRDMVCAAARVSGCRCPSRAVEHRRNPAGAFHFELGKKLAPLRDERILIIGSGNLVHNLHAYAWGRHMPDPYDWAVRFETKAKEMMLAGEYKALVDYEKLGRERCCPFRRQIITCRCYMCSAPAGRVTSSLFQSKASMADPYRCCAVRRVGNGKNCRSDRHYPQPQRAAHKD